MKTNITKTVLVLSTLIILDILKVPLVFNFLTVISTLLLVNFYLAKKKRIEDTMLSSVKVYQKKVYFREYVFTDKIKKAYYKEYKLKPTIEENEFMIFLNSNLTQSEVISFFAETELRSKRALANLTPTVTEKYASQQPSVYHITYYTDATLNVINSLNGKPLTKDDIGSFTLFLDKTGRQKGQKVYKEDLDKWQQEVNK